MNYNIDTRYCQEKTKTYVNAHKTNNTAVHKNTAVLLRMNILSIRDM